MRGRASGAACGAAATCWIRKQMTFILSLAALLKGESVQVISNETDQTLFLQLNQKVTIDCYITTHFVRWNCLGDSLMYKIHKSNDNQLLYFLLNWINNASSISLEIACILTAVKSPEALCFALRRAVGILTSHDYFPGRLALPLFDSYDVSHVCRYSKVWFDLFLC